MQRWFGRRDQDSSPDSVPMDEASILRILDKACDDIAFPMLDNGYVYLAAARLSLFSSSEDWAIAFEIFGFSPRSGIPDVSVWTLGRRLAGRKTPVDFVNRSAYDNYLKAHAHDDAAFFFPVEGDWQDEDDPELVSPTATHAIVRGTRVAIPDRQALVTHGIDLVEPDRVQTFELCRYLAAVDRAGVLATDAERRTHVPADLEEILLLDDWHHPDAAGGQHASDTAAFRSIARVLVTGDVRDYDPSEAPNSHWSNWPDGGTL